MQNKTTVVYKLTNRDMTTHGGFRWELGKQATAPGEGELCGPGWLHCYSDPLLAVLLNPIHANIENPRLFRAEAGGKSKHDQGLKSGYTKMTLIEEIPVPDVTTEQRVRFGILCSTKVYNDPTYTSWAGGWLSGKDRSAAAAEAAWAASEAAWASSWAVETAWASWAAVRAAEAAWAAARAAARAAEAAWVASGAARVDIDLVAIAREACSGLL